MKKTLFNILQGCAVANHNGSYDLTLINSFETLESALIEFENVKKDSNGWVYPVLITEIEKVDLEYSDEDEEWIETGEYDLIEHYEFNKNDNEEEEDK